MNNTATKPDAAKPEPAMTPFATEEYRTEAQLRSLLALAGVDNVRVTHAVKVQADGRLVVEFQAVRCSVSTPKRPIKKRPEVPGFGYTAR